MNRSRKISMTTVATIATILFTPITIPPILKLSDRKAGSRTACERAEMKFWNSTCRIIATAKLVISIVAPDPLRTGRKAIRSIRTAATIEAQIASGTDTTKGTPAIPQYIST